MKLDTMMEAIEVLARERGVAIDTILDAFANALVAAYKRSPGAAEEARVTIDPDSGEVIVYAQELDEDGNVVPRMGGHPRGGGLRPHRRADLQAGDAAASCARRSASTCSRCTKVVRATS